MATNIENYLNIHKTRLEETKEVIKRLELTKDARVLEIGCYPTEALFNYLAKNYQAYGIASKHEPVKGKNIKICNVETEKLPFEDHFFDLVTFCEVIEHLNHPEATLAEIYRVLKPVGKVLITTPNRFHLKNLVTLNAWRHKASGDYYEHNHEFTPSELINLVESFKFSVLSCQLQSVYTPGRLKEYRETELIKLIKLVGYYLTLALPPVRDTIFLVAQRKI